MGVAMASERVGPLTAAVATDAGERLVSLDIIRALAYFAVLVIHASIFAIVESHGSSNTLYSQGGLNRIVAELTDIFIRGKGISSFSMLFGIGFFILFERAAAKGRSVLPLALRRLGLLFVMGALHYRFVWTGDVLILYASLGLMLLPFLNARPRTMLAAGLGIFLLFSLVPNIAHALGLDPRWSIESWHLPEVQSLGNKPLHGLFEMEVPVRIGRTIARMIHEAGSILPLFLLGAALWRSGLIAAPVLHAAKLRKVFVFSLSLGLVLSFLVHDPFHWIPAEFQTKDYGTEWSLLEDVGTFSLALGYVTGLLRLLTQPVWTKRLSVVAPLGRMALTNYLTHTLLLMMILKALMSLGCPIGSAMSFGVALAIYAIQLAWSHAWLARFRFGPVEWFWRGVTYLRPAPMRISPNRP